MNTISHRIFLSALAMTVILAAVILTINGSDYYLTTLHERHAHNLYNSLKPTGTLGHGLGIAGSLLIITGVFGYMVRKRSRSMSRMGLLKHWLEFHIFLCLLGPILVLFHTSFKFGGIIAISFWSMAIVVFSGIIGRYIYLQIPRSIGGRELTLNEMKKMEADYTSMLNGQTDIHQETQALFLNWVLKIKALNDRNPIIRVVRQNAYKREALIQLKQHLKKTNLSRKQSRQVIRIFNSKIKLARRISQLTTMQKLFRYWHIAHLPFAMTMFLIMFIHIAVAILFGYIWIF